MPQRPNRVRLTAPRRQRQSSVDQGAAESAGTLLDTAPDVGEIQEESIGTVGADQRLDMFAQLLWLPAAGLRKAALIEAELNGAYAEVESSVSDYRLRQLARDGPEAQRKRDDAVLRLSRDKERARRERDYHHVPLMQLARGIKMLDKQVKHSVWSDETKARQVVGRKLAKQAVHRMHALRPLPDYPVHALVYHVTHDNTYATQQKGLGSQRSRNVERVDSNGDSVEVFRMHYVNSFGVPVDQREVEMSQQEWALIAQRGPYSGAFQRVLVPLQPAASVRVMDTLLEEAAGRAASALHALHVSGLHVSGQAPTLQQKAEAIQKTMLGRNPDIEPPTPAYIKDFPPIFDCNTHSYEDLVRIIAHLENQCETTPLVLRVNGDGQSCIFASFLKSRWPERYKHLLITNGHKHSWGHDMFCGIRLYWRAIFARLAARLGKTRVTDFMKDMSDDNFDDAEDFLSSVAVASSVFLACCVTDPPPELFFKDPAKYKSMVGNVDGIAILEALQWVALPATEWHRAARECNGERVDELHGLAFHKFRAAHKVMSRKITLLHLLSTHATAPAISKWIRATPSDTWVTYPQYYDAIQEGKNLSQKARNTSHDLAASLHFTPMQVSPLAPPPPLHSMRLLVLIPNPNPNARRRQWLTSRARTTP